MDTFIFGEQFAVDMAVFYKLNLFRYKYRPAFNLVLTDDFSLWYTYNISTHTKPLASNSRSGWV